MFIENHIVFSTKVFWVSLRLWTGPDCCLEASCLGRSPCKCTVCACCTFALTASDSSSDPKYIPHFATEEKKWMDLERSDGVHLGIFHVSAKDLERELGPQYLHWNRQNVICEEHNWNIFVEHKGRFWLQTECTTGRGQLEVLDKKEEVQWRSALVYCACAQSVL